MKTATYLKILDKMLFQKVLPSSFFVYFHDVNKRKIFLTLSYLTIWPFRFILGIAFKLHGILPLFDKLPHNDDGKYFCDMASSTRAGTAAAAYVHYCEGFAF